MEYEKISKHFKTIEIQSFLTHYNFLIIFCIRPTVWRFLSMEMQRSIFCLISIKCRRVLPAPSCSAVFASDKD